MTKYKITVTCDIIVGLEEEQIVIKQIERSNAETGLVCALCGGPIRETLAASYCPSCGVEGGPMLPADVQQVTRYGVETPTGRWFDGQEKGASQTGSTSKTGDDPAGSTGE